MKRTLELLNWRSSSYNGITHGKKKEEQKNIN
jgi:hypothetical protein